MASRTLRRNLLIAAGVVLLLALVLLAAVPIWFPWVLKPLSRNLGLSYSGYERDTNGHFTLRDVTYTNDQFELRASRMGAMVPSAWWWHLKVAPSNETARLSVEDWELNLKPKENQARGAPAAEAHGPSTKPLGEQLDHAVASINRWLPHAQFTNGTLRSGKTVVHVPSMSWDQAQVSGSVRYDDSPVTATLNIDLRSQPYRLKLRSDPLDLSLAARVSTNGSGLSMETTAFWHSNKVEAAAQFPPANLVPASAVLLAPDIRLPPELLELPQYSPLRTAVQVTWTNGQFELHATGSAEPLPTATNLPPLEFGISAQGTTNEAVVRSAFISSPWLRADLSHDAVLLAHSPWLRDPAEFTIKADLDQQHWVDLQGELQATATFTPAAKAAPKVSFQVQGSDLSHDTLRMESLALSGELDWPLLRIPTFEAGLEPGSRVVLSAAADLSRKFIQDARFSIVSEKPLPLVPTTVEYSGLSVTGTFSGPFLNPVHHAEGHLEHLALPGLKPFSITLLSEGYGMQSTNFAFTLSPRPGSELSLAGSFAFTNEQAQMFLRELRLSSNGQSVLSATEPAALRFHPSSSTEGWSAAVDSLALSGSAGALDLAAHVGWPQRGRVQISANGLSSAIFDDFAPPPSLPLNIKTFIAAALWTNGPVSFQTTAVLSGMSNFPFQAELRLRGDTQGINLEQVALVQDTNLLASLQGRLPLSIVPQNEEILHLDPQGPIDLRSFFRPHGDLWSRLTELTGIELVDPELVTKVSGTWSDPNARLEFKASRIVPGSSKPTTPRIGPIDLVVEADQAKARIEHLNLKVQDQPIFLTAEIPLGKDFWRLTGRRKIPDWTEASARLYMPRTPLAAFESVAPGLLAPEGDLSFDILLRPGGNLDGDFNVIGARTDSIGTLGPIRNLTLRVLFKDQDARLNYGRAQIGGSTVWLNGTADFDPAHFGPAGPPFKLTLRGEQVPLSRQPDSIIRANLALQIIGTNQAQPLLTGRVTMTNSYFLSDLAALVPGKVAAPKKYPPYFSIEEDPIADWRLDVQVGGQRGMKVRSPLFNGEVTPNVHLTGTLREPIAVGDVRVDGGKARFPFGSLEVQQGLVTASPEDPTHPKLSVTAAERQFGYDIRMEVTGPIDSPIVQFSSSPPLASDQVLLMLTAGQLPRGTYSLTPQQRAQTFALFIGRDLLSKLGVEPGEERFVVRSGEEFSEEGRLTYDLEYKLSKRWSLTGEYDRFGDYNAGFKWRVFSK